MPPQAPAAHHAQAARGTHRRGILGDAGVCVAVCGPPVCRPAARGPAVARGAVRAVCAHRRLAEWSSCPHACLATCSWPARAASWRGWVRAPACTLSVFFLLLHHALTITLTVVLLRSSASAATAHFVVAPLLAPAQSAFSLVGPRAPPTAQSSPAQQPGASVSVRNIASCGAGGLAACPAPSGARAPVCEPA